MGKSNSSDSAVIKALKILKVFNSSQSTWRIGEISDELGY